MNTNGIFDAMNEAMGGTLRRYDAAEVAAGREPAGVQMWEATAALVAACYFKAMGPMELDDNLRRAEMAINAARSAARQQATREYDQIAAGDVAGIERFKR